MSMFQPLVDFGKTAMGGLDGAWKWFGSGDNMRNFGTLVGGLGSAYGAYDQAKNAKKMIDLQIGAYNRDVKKEDERDAAFNAAWGGQK